MLIKFATVKLDYFNKNLFQLNSFKGAQNQVRNFSIWHCLIILDSEFYEFVDFLISWE